MKKIRFDFYEYRIRKGQASILLEPVADEPETYRIPFRYVKKEERIGPSISSTSYRVGDDGDLILYQIVFRKTHMGPVRGKEWVPLDCIRELKLIAFDPLAVRVNIFTFILDTFPREGDAGLQRRLYEMQEIAKTDFFRQCYACELQNALDGEWSNVSLSPPDPALVQEELRTLAHFRRHRPKEGPAMKMDDVLDGYEPIDWVALGSRPTE